MTATALPLHAIATVLPLAAVLVTATATATSAALATATRCWEVFMDMFLKLEV